MTPNKDFIIGYIQKVYSTYKIIQLTMYKTMYIIKIKAVLCLYVIGNQNRGMKMLKKVPYLKTGIFLLIVILSGMKVCFAEDSGWTLVNENFETGYIDRGDVHSNLLLSESYDAFADQKKCGYMVYQQVTVSNYSFDSGDRAGYDSSERLHAGYHEKYGNLGSAIYLYPET